MFLSSVLYLKPVGYSAFKKELKELKKMSKYQYRKRVSKKLLCNNRIKVEVNGIAKSKPISELIKLYPKEVWRNLYSKAVPLSLSSSCYHQLEDKIKIVAPELIEERDKKKRIRRANAKARKYYNL